MRDPRDMEARLTVLRRLLHLVTDPRAANAIRQIIAELETRPAHLPDAPQAAARAVSR